MSNTANLYWLTRIDSINTLIGIMAFILLLVSGGIYLACWVGTDFDQFHKNEIEQRKAIRKKYRNKTRWLIPLGMFLFIISVLSPSKNEVIFIVAGSKTLDFIQSDTSLNKIPAQTTAIISQFLNNQIKELEGKDKSKENKK